MILLIVRTPAIRITKKINPKRIPEVDGTYVCGVLC
jgi:hypothetical protein